MKKLGFGMMRLPLLDPKVQGQVDLDQVCRMVDLFLERGFTYFDTAYMYHDYQSERVVRKALVERHPRDSFTLATKMPTMPYSINSSAFKIVAFSTVPITLLYKERKPFMLKLLSSLWD